MSNRLSTVINTCNKAPVRLRPWLLSKLFRFAVPFTGSAAIVVNHLTTGQCSVTVRNKRRTRNHIGGVHACATTLAAESATGFAVGISVPDNRVPVIKNITIDFVKRATGAITACAHLTDKQLEQINSQDKGEVLVACTVTDENGIEPVKVQMLWAWTPKRR